MRIPTMNILSMENKCSQVLNKGFVKMIDCMPRVIPSNQGALNCDHAIVEAARVSYGQKLKTFEEDEKLIKYLLRHSHTSPFEQVRFKFHIKAPIFVQRQWIRHRTASVNEISGRYTNMKGEFYIPDFISSQSNNNKQASESIITDKHIKDQFDEYMRNSIEQYSKYTNLIRNGVSRETARIGLPLNMYTEFFWNIDLHNLFNFIRLRDSPDAQPEIRDYAVNIKDMIRSLCPISINAFEDYKQKSVTFSRQDCEQIDVTVPHDLRVICGIPLNQLKNSEQKELDRKVSTVNNMPEIEGKFLL